MEKWVRGLSKPVALLIGLAGVALAWILYNSIGGILGGALLGACIGFSFVMFFKGITGQTPQERNEAKRKGKS